MTASVNSDLISNKRPAFLFLQNQQMISPNASRAINSSRKSPAMGTPHRLLGAVITSLMWRSIFFKSPLTPNTLSKNENARAPEGLLQWNQRLGRSAGNGYGDTASGSCPNKNGDARAPADDLQIARADSSGTKNQSPAPAQPERQYHQPGLSDSSSIRFE